MLNSLAYHTAGGLWQLLRAHLCAAAVLVFVGAMLGVAVCSARWRAQIRGASPPTTSQQASGALIPRVRASDIGNRVVIVGNLDVPIGELVTITGEWSVPELPQGAFPPKDRQLQLLVMSVNGEPANVSVIFPTTSVLPVVHGGVKELPRNLGDIWELRGAETGGFEEPPPDAVADMSEEKRKMPVQFRRGFGFYTRFLYSSCRIIGQTERQKTAVRPPTVQRHTRKDASNEPPDPFQLERSGGRGWE
jgi:hypothetical protein